MVEKIGSQGFSSREEAFHSVARSMLSNVDLPQNLIEALLEGSDIVEKIQITPPDIPATASPAIFRSFRYVIRDDDLYTFGTFLDLLKVTLGLGIGVLSLTTPAGYKAIGDSLHGLYGIYKSIMARGERLHEIELLLLMELKDLGTASAEELSAIVQRKGVEIHPQAVEAFLARHERREGNGFTRRVHPTGWSLDGV